MTTNKTPATTANLKLGHLRQRLGFTKQECIVAGSNEKVWEPALPPQASQSSSDSPAGGAGVQSLYMSTPEIFAPFLAPSRYKAAHGGRGSGKSHFLASLLVETCLINPTTRAVCIREVQKTLKDSSKRLIEDTIQKYSLGKYFIIMHDCIKVRDRLGKEGGVIVFMGMQDANAESIKSLEGFDVAWVEEAQTISTRSLNLLRPTIRKEGSEIWFSYNPRRKTDAIDAMLARLSPSYRAANLIEVTANWRDNPYFPTVLEQERLECLTSSPEEYPHIWEGEYLKILAGAYYSAQLLSSASSQHICALAPDPLLPYKAAIDIGGTGASADAFSMWIFQLIGKEVRFLNYYERRSQPLSAHLTWMRSQGYTEENTKMYIPHDGVQGDKIYATSYEKALQEAGFETQVIKNQGRGAALQRVEAARRLFPNIWFDEEKTEAGREALSWYHETLDPTRNIGLGPCHDWSSHGSDSFGLAAIVATTEQSQQGGGDLDYSGMDSSRLSSYSFMNK